MYQSVYVSDSRVVVFTGFVSVERVRRGYCGRKRGKIHARFMIHRVAFCRRFSWRFIFWHWVFARHSHSHFLGVLASVAIVAALPGFTTFWLAFFPSHFCPSGVYRCSLLDARFSVFCFRCSVLSSLFLCHAHLASSEPHNLAGISSTTTSVYLYLCIYISVSASTALQPKRTERTQARLVSKWTANIIFWTLCHQVDVASPGAQTTITCCHSSCSPFGGHCPAELLEFLESHSKSDCGSRSHGLCLRWRRRCTNCAPIRQQKPKTLQMGTQKYTRSLPKVYKENERSGCKSKRAGSASFVAKNTKINYNNDKEQALWPRVRIRIRIRIRARSVGQLWMWITNSRVRLEKNIGYEKHGEKCIYQHFRLAVWQLKGQWCSFWTGSLEFAGRDFN